MTSITEPRRLAQLPGYDTAPDVYETPSTQLSGVDEATVTPSTSVSQEDSSSSDPDSDASTASSSSQFGGVSRRRLYPSQARKHFSSASVRTRNVDLSDRVDGRRQGYRVRSGTSRDRGDGEKEGLEARIARLKREVEECRIETGRRQANADSTGDSTSDETSELGRILAGLETAPPPPPSSTSPAPTREPNASSHAADSSTLSDPQALSKLATFDTRLAALESSLGLGSLEHIPATPLLPTLTLLDHQLSALSTASSLANLESLAARISTLKASARTLSLPSPVEPRPTAASSDADSASASDADADADEPPSPALTASDRARLADLFALLPSLAALAPTVPPLLARLKSLRTLHAAAARAGADLDALETRQADLAAGLKAWRDGLERVEEAVEEADAGNGKNGRVVKEWVDDLEGRMRALSG